MSTDNNKIQIMFTTSNSPSSWLIRLFTWSKWSHVEYVFGEWVIGAVELQGVRKEPLDLMKLRCSRWEIYEFEGDNVGMAKTMHSIIGLPYDYSAILGIVFRRNWEESLRWFCSEAIVWAARQNGVNLIADAKHRVTPRDLSISQLLTKVDQSD